MEYRIERRDRFQIMGLAGQDSLEKEGSMTSLWNRFMDKYDPVLWNNGNPSFYTAPFHQICAYEYVSKNGRVNMIIGAEYKGDMPVGADISVQDVPAATWAVFTFYGETGYDKYNIALTRILTEWLPASRYVRDEAAPNLDVFPSGTIDEHYAWEIWMPVRDK